MKGVILVSAVAIGYALAVRWLWKLDDRLDEVLFL